MLCLPWDTVEGKGVQDTVRTRRDAATVSEVLRVHFSGLSRTFTTSTWWWKVI